MGELPPSTHLSFAQQGEDLIVENILGWFKIFNPTYLDIGANDPVRDSNTYLFYRKGARGVLVEPNPVFCDKLRRERPGDGVLQAGIGGATPTEADYYVIRGAAANNTFSKEQADYLTRQYGPGTVEKVIKVPLVPINAVIADNFDGVPNFLSIDTEGMDLTILQSLDFRRYRPHVVCVETLVPETGVPDETILSLMRSKDYSIRGATFVNTIFLANELLERVPTPLK